VPTRCRGRHYQDSTQDALHCTALHCTALHCAPGYPDHQLPVTAKQSRRRVHSPRSLPRPAHCTALCYTALCYTALHPAEPPVGPNRANWTSSSMFSLTQCSEYLCYIGPRCQLRGACRAPQMAEKNCRYLGPTVGHCGPQWVWPRFQTARSGPLCEAPGRIHIMAMITPSR
jgi:hypothetical protein